MSLTLERWKGVRAVCGFVSEEGEGYLLKFEVLLGLTSATLVAEVAEKGENQCAYEY